jgi:UV DNA damage repair endonuclease
MSTVQDAVHGLAWQKAETLRLELHPDQFINISVDPRIPCLRILSGT